MGKCIICDSTFESSSKKQVFCSNSCRQKNYRIETQKLLKEIRQKRKEIKIQELPIKEPKLAVSTPKVDSDIKIEKEPFKSPKKEIKEMPPNLGRLEKMRWMRENS